MIAQEAQVTKGAGRIFWALLLLFLWSALPAALWSGHLWIDGVLGGAVPALLTPLIAVGLAVIAAKRSDEVASQGGVRASLLYTGAILGMMAGNLLALWQPSFLMIAGLSLPVGAYGLCKLALGDRARRFLFPCCFLIFLLPFEYFLRPYCDAPLQALTATLAQAFLNVAGYNIRMWGEHTIYNALYYVRVDETCSGMNLLWTLWMYGLVFGWLTDRRVWVRGILCACVVPLAMLANGLRVAVIMLLGIYGGDDWAMGFWHTGSAYLIFLPVFFALYIVGQALKGRYR